MRSASTKVKYGAVYIWAMLLKLSCNNGTAETLSYFLAVSMFRLSKPRFDSQPPPKAL